MEYKVGELVLLPETKYPGVIGSVISENKSGIKSCLKIAYS